MNDDDWKQRVDFLEIKALENARECARQHVALGQLLEIVEEAKEASEDHQSPDLLMRFEAILRPYASWIQKFRATEWALQDRAPTHPIAEDIHR